MARSEGGGECLALPYLLSTLSLRGTYIAFIFHRPSLKIIIDNFNALFRVPS